MTKEKSKNQIEIEKLEKELKHIFKCPYCNKKLKKIENHRLKCSYKDCDKPKFYRYPIEEEIEIKAKLQATKQADKNARADFKKLINEDIKKMTILKNTTITRYLYELIEKI